ncbi:MAG: family 20 glycosylhydrolase [Phycisphaerales bacterium]|nr:family 20 glycosylhydrolase [Phycisphaerales bacterium]
MSALLTCGNVTAAAAPPTHEQAANPHRRVLEVGHVRVVVEPWQQGVSIFCDGIPISTGSNMVVTTPPWTPHFYLGPDQAAVAGATVAEVEGGLRLTMRHRGRHDAFLAEDVITVTAGRVERVLTGEFTPEEGEALIQWRVASLAPTPIMGRGFRATYPQREPHVGTVPVVAISGDVEPSTVANRFETLEFDTRIGPVRLTVDAPHALICYDFRMNKWADPARPFFWVGDTGTRFRKGTPLRYRFLFELPPPAAATEERAVEHKLTVNTHPAAQTFPLDEPPVLIPRPKEVTCTARDFELGPRGVTVDRALPAFIPADDHPAHGPALVLAEFLRKRVVLKEGGAERLQFRIVPADASRSEEWYKLSVSSDGIELGAQSTAGFFHAVHTLQQLFAERPDGNAIFRGAEVQDWPSLPFRGIHLFSGGRGPETHLRLIEHLLGPLKLNHLVFQCEYIRWDAAPEIHHPRYGMPKDDVRKILAACRRLGIEVTPLVMSLGHCDWMFIHNQNLDLAEDPEAKWAYCVTNPRTYEFIYAIYAEALELFQPKWFHIGHDEFTERGRVPYRESSRPYTAEELFLMDTQRHHEWFAERGVRVMMWGDMLLGPGEAPDAAHAKSVESARRKRDALPKDILIADWHYVTTTPENYRNLEVFRDAGFTPIAATWYRPANITNFARAAYDRGALGLLQTTWAGYSLDPESFERELHQYAAYVLAAEAAWNADNPPSPDEYPAGTFFLDLMGMSALPPANRRGWTADLATATNYDLAAHDAAGWFGLGPDHDLRSVRAGNVRLGGVKFCLSAGAAEGTARGVLFRSRLTRDEALPTQMTFRLEGPTDTLALLLVSGFAAATGEDVGTLSATWDDGTTAELVLRYGEHVFAWNDLNAAPAAPIVWRGRSSSGELAALRAVIWNLPPKSSRLKSLTLHSAAGAGGLLLLGITGLEHAQP